MNWSLLDYKPERNISSLARSYQVPEILVAVGLGLISALLVVKSPYLGVGFVFGLIVYIFVCNRAELAFAILIFSFAIPVQKTLAGLPLNFTDATVVLWGMAWPFLMIRKYNQGPEYAASFYVPKPALLAAGLVIAAFISLLDAENFGGSLKQAIRLVEWLIVLPILFMSVQAGKVFWTVAASAFLIVPPLFALDGVVEVFNNGNSISRMIGIPHPIPSDETSEIKHTFDVSGRAGSTFGGAQGLAMYLTMMMAAIVAIAIKPPKPFYRVLAIGAFLVCLAGMYFANSRGGFLGCLAMLTVMMLISYPKVAIRILLIGGTGLALIFIGFLIFYGWDGTVAGLIPGRAEAVLDRLIIWTRAISVFAEHPINGVGFGGFRDNVYNNEPLRLNVGLGYESLHCHNTYLEVLTGTGLIGFSAYVIFLVLTWKHLLQAWFNRKGLKTDCFILCGLGSMAAYMMFGMVDMLWLQNMHMVLFTMLSLAFMAARLDKEVFE
ncbi:MAG: O-antigen ligase family protein [Alphaproteobacteria bacterium]